MSRSTLVSDNRFVYTVKWGRTPSSSHSFHHCILVRNDRNVGKINEESHGVIFDWGSLAGGQSNKFGEPARVKPFDATAYAKGVEMGNTYVLEGMTDWDDDFILAEMNKLGSHYNLLNNNCQQVVAKLVGQGTQHLRSGRKV